MQWNTNSSGEIVTLSNFWRWLQVTGGGYYIPEASEKFTDNFTIEFDLYFYQFNKFSYLDTQNFIFVSGST